MIEIDYLNRCIETLEIAYTRLQNCHSKEIEYTIYRSAVVKEFEVILEQSGKLLKKCLKPYFHSSKAVDQLVFKDIFREAGRFGFLEIEEVQRWLEYRDSRNETSHEYGENLADQTLTLIESFIFDAKHLIHRIKQAQA